MNLVEAETEGPVEGDAALITPPRPPHRRVSVSLVFTISVLVGTVVTIYAVFPARHNVLITEALDRYHEAGDAADKPDLVQPGAAELRAWLLGAVGRDAPVPGPRVTVIDGRVIEVLSRRAALMTVELPGTTEHLTLLMQHARGFIPDHAERREDGLLAVEWKVGATACVAVGPEASAPAWRAALGAR